MIHCAICDLTVDGDQWFSVTVVDDGDPTTGFLCSLDCLTDYVAKVHAELAL